MNEKQLVKQKVKQNTDPEIRNNYSYLADRATHTSPTIYL